MSVHISAGKDVRRGDFFFIDPFEINVKEELRGRHTPPTEEDVISMAHSLMEFGQRQPVECRRIEGNRLQLTLGFTRVAAARLIREGFEGGTDKNFKIKVVLTDANDDLAFQHNVVENAHRNQTSSIDDAFNQARLRDRNGMSDTDIAKLYRCSPATVGNLRKLLGLDKKIQTQIHEGKMSVIAGLDLLELPDDKRQAAVADAVKDNGKVSGAEVRKKVREHILSDDNQPPRPAASRINEPKPKKSKARSIKEIKDFFEAKREATKDKAHKELCTVLLLWINGLRTDESLDEAIFK